ncbi:MAG: CoA-binding protein [Acidobacteria bacterium]|nr:CoA-binding protein [Acidobacteriota bacterium]
MVSMPDSVGEFLSRQRIAVAGVSRKPDEAANLIFRKLRDASYEVFAVNPNAAEVEGVHSYPDLASIPGGVEAVVVATHPKVSAQIVRQCADLGISKVWFHRAFGEGSVSEEALEECSRLGIDPIVGGCPMMYCAPVDFGHRCMRWLLKHQGKIPA